MRQRPHQANLFLSIYQPKTLFACQVMSGTYNLGDLQINYMNVSTGTYLNLYEDLTFLIGSTVGGDDYGRLRMRSATGTYIVFAENAINWQQGLYLTALDQIDVVAKYPRIIQDPSNPMNVIFYKDYDIAYSNQNSIYGTFVNAGPHRAGFISSGTFFFSATGTTNLLGDSLTYSWIFEGGTPTGSTSLTPGNVKWNSPGHYKVRLRTTSSSGAVDDTYRYVSLYSRPNEGTNPPILQWELQSLSGSRAEGGYTASFKVYQDLGTVQPNAIVVIFSDDIYGSTRTNLGGNAIGNSSIVFVGYIIGDSIKFNYQTSSVEFSVGSISEIMKNAEGFSVSCESKASPSTWFELYEMNVPRAMYHYLKWHSTVLKVADFQYTGDSRLVQYFDADRTSLYDAVDTFLRDGILGELVTDRQGKLWAEISSFGLLNPFSSLSNYLTIQKQDWMNDPQITERRNSDMAFIELGGIAYYGVSSNTFSALLSNAPSVAPLYHGKSDRKEGLILTSQTQLNQLSGNYLAYNNTQFPEISISMNGIYTNLDIAPQERYFLVISPSDTVRNKSLQGISYILDSMEWKYQSAQQTFTPDIVLHQIATGTAGVTVEIPVTPPDFGYSYPSLNLPPLPTFVYNTNPVGSSIPTKVIFHDTNKGLIYTDNFDSDNPQYITINGGLTDTQYKNINVVFVCPNGAIYAARCAANNTAFIARAPYVGAPFTIVEDSTTIAAKHPGTYTNIHAIYYNPNLSESVVYILQSENGNGFTYIGGAGSYSLGYTFTNLTTLFPTDVTEWQYRLRFSTDRWVFFGWKTGSSDTMIYVLSQTASSLVTSYDIGGISAISGIMRCVGQTKQIFLVGDLGFTGLKRADNNDASTLIVVSTDPDIKSVGLTVAPDGLYMMDRYGVGNKGRSSDGGATWLFLPNLPPGNYYWAYAGMGTSVSSSRWIAAGAVVRFSPDFGNTWLNREGDLSTVAPLPNINVICVPGTGL